MTGTEKPTSIDFIIPCFNQENVITGTVLSILNQEKDEHIHINIIIVNDDSTDGTGDVINNLEREYPCIRVIHSEKNEGRSATRNTGIINSSSEFCILLDGDCLLEDTYTVNKFIRYFNDGYELVIGNATARKDQFWGNYQRDIIKKRNRDRNIHDLTVALTGFKRTVIERGEEITLFDPLYKYYGFEDRDYLIRLTNLVADEKIKQATDIYAIHQDDIKLGKTCEKMRISAQFSAPIFFSRHLDYYLASRYACFDKQFMPKSTQSIMRIISPVSRQIIHFGEIVLKYNLIPYWVKRKYVMLCMALSYYSGSTHR